jgi:hypothetical protein
MTRTQGMASSRPQTTVAATISHTSSRRMAPRGRRRFARRELLALPAVLALLVPAAPALAATGTGTSSTGTAGYNQKPPTPTTKTEPKKEVEPSKTESTPTATTPKAAVEPAKETTTPTTPTAKASTLPFTGLNLTWVVGAGVLLLGAGLSIRLALRTRSGR